MKIAFFLLFFTLQLNFTGTAQSLNSSRLDSFFNALAARDLAMGSLTISVNGKVLYKKVIGNAYIGDFKKIRADENTKYRIGSVSKMFTAVMIFQLIEEGKLDLQQPVSKYFHGIPNGDRISISNLLNHRSGLHNYTEGTNYPDWMSTRKSKDEMLSLIRRSAYDYEPNARAEYSNTNYLLLSYIIEEIEHSSYRQVLNKRIIAPVGLPNTYYGNRIDSSMHESTSYKYFQRKWIREKETDMSIHSGAGSIISTPTDLVKFVHALFTYKLVKKSSLDKMTTLVDDYGMGLFPFRFDGTTGYGHNGRIEGFSTSLQYFPVSKLAIAYCTNGQVYAKDDILKAVHNICFNKAFSIPLFNPVIIPHQELIRYTGRYSSSQMPIKVAVTSDKNRLVLETKGQLFMLEPIGKNFFMHTPYGFFFEFYPEQEELIIKETDNVFYLKKER